VPRYWCPPSKTRTTSNSVLHEVEADQRQRSRKLVRWMANILGIVIPKADPFSKILDLALSMPAVSSIFRAHRGVHS
jgi:hypothetical protein